MNQDPSQEPIERWAAKRRVALIVSILKGEAVELILVPSTG